MDVHDETDLDRVAAIELEANVTTGFRWEAQLNDDSPLRVLGAEYLHEPAGMLGASGIQRVYVCGAGRGSGELTLRYK